MAWIESHQELARHPKTKRLARLLGVSLPAAIGHLHFLWWWAMDYAQDGDLSRYDEYDIADACGWEGDEKQIVDALIESGFVDKTDDGLVIHDWYDYAGRLIEKREQNRERKRRSRAKAKVESESHADVTRPSRGQHDDGSESHGATKPNLTEPNLTEPNQVDQQHNPNFMRAHDVFEREGFGTLSSLLVDQINDLISEYSEEWVIRAMYESVKAGKRNLRYVYGILKNWKAHGIDGPWKGGKPNENDRASPAGGVDSEYLRQLERLSGVG